MKVGRENKRKKERQSHRYGQRQSNEERKGGRGERMEWRVQEERREKGDREFPIFFSRGPLFLLYLVS